MDIFEKPVVISPNVLENLGPFTAMVGTWEGDQGIDVSAGKRGPRETRFREQMSLLPLGPIVTGPQVLYGLKYATSTWPLGQERPFHEEVGYLLWDAKEEQAMRCFTLSCGVSLIAGGHANPRAKSIFMKAALGSETYGILSNPFLNDAFRTVKYELNITLHEDGGFSYAQDRILKIHGRDELFHHTDRNKLYPCK